MSELPGFVLKSADPQARVPQDWFEGRSERSASKDLERGARFFHLQDHARVAVDTALALGEPILVTGEPGTGKTQLAYYLSWVLYRGKPLHFQVQSTSQARDLRYRFDDVAYFHAAGTEEGAIDRERFLRRGVLWEALVQGREQRRPQVVLIDEVDKAPRDFPNDLLRDLDQYEWTVPELDDREVGLGADEQDLKPVVIITSNLERELPGPFLRRCLYLHLPFSRDVVLKALKARSGELGAPSHAFLELVVQRFMDVRDKAQRKRPSTSEAITWVRALRLAGVTEEQLQGVVDDTPYLELLIKSHEGLRAFGRSV